MLALPFAPSRASASTDQLSIIQDGSLLKSPATAMPLVRSLGARVIRVSCSGPWSPPDRRPRSKPDFAASNPRAYPAANWAPYDQLVQTAQQDGIRVDLEVTGGAPRWAEGKNPPRAYRADTSFGWRPDPKLYGQFVHAVTERYDGHFTPQGSTGPLPAVHFWSFWNEPNFGQDLGPQAIDGSTKPIAPALYRSLLDTGYAALRQDPTRCAQHRADRRTGRDRVPAARARPPRPAAGRHRADPGAGLPACAVLRHRPLQAPAGLDRDPVRVPGDRRRSTSVPLPEPGAVQRERVRRPSVRLAAGPEREPRQDQQWLCDLSGAQPGGGGAGRGHRRVRIAHATFRSTTTNTGTSRVRPSPRVCATRPRSMPRPSSTRPNTSVTRTRAWRPTPSSCWTTLSITPQHPKPGFSSGLYTATGQPKATLAAYRLPLWLPRATVKAGSESEIWGGARPAAFATSAPGAGEPTVAIQTQKYSQSGWTTIRTVEVSEPTGYFDIHLQLPYSGRPEARLHLPTDRAVPPHGRPRHDDLRADRQGHDHPLTDAPIPSPHRQALRAC